MSNILKSKLILITGSITVLVFIHLFNTNFYAPVTLFKWKQLNWDDFQGFAKPFTGWDASINSSVFIEYDSSTTKYVAYSAMNNQLSWRKNSALESNYLLNHEQYHFNITEYFARKLNKIIEADQIVSESNILLNLSRIRTELAIMQDRYDNESDHSIIRDQQRKWEFKIDSMLSLYVQNSGFATDYYSGGTIHMPSNFNFYEGIHENASSYRIYQTEKYDMTLSMTSFQYLWLPVETMTERLIEYYKLDSLDIIRMEFDSSIYDYQANVEAFDSLNHSTTFHLWTHHENFLYKVTANFYIDSTKSAYRDIARSFIRSFKIIDTKEYWIEKFGYSDSTININSTVPSKPEDDSDSSVSEKCATNGNVMQYGFHGKPIFRNDGALLVPFRIVEHADSLIHEIMLLHNEKWYTYEQGQGDQIYFIPKENLKEDNISIQFGYLLKQDSINKCYTFYYQTKEIENKKN